MAAVPSMQSEQFLAGIRRTVNDVVRQLSTESVPRNSLGAISQRLDTLGRNITNASGALLTVDQADQLQRQIDILQEKCRELCSSTATGFEYHAPEVHNTDRTGRPSLLVPEAQLRFLVSVGFSNKEIAEMLHISIATVQRRIRSYKIQRKSQEQDMSDPELDLKIQTIIRGNQSLGPNSVKARLASTGVQVSRKRVRDAMHRIDSLACAQRSVAANNRLNRRKYSVAAPLSLCHIDGNHKLIRWGIVIHGGIDGFSRMIVFLHASDNNRAETVFNLFQESVHKYGLPSRIRVDKGGENNIICHLMEEIRGPDRGSAIRGRSVHNQRIERSWVDVWNGCTNVFHNLFQYLESTGDLNPDNSHHMWALHFVFLPRINRALIEFTGQWNNHGLRTEHYSTPQQMFVRGVLANYNSNLTAIRDLFDTGDQEDNAPVQLHQVASTSRRVVVPRINCPLTPDRLEILRGTIDPLDDTYDEQGIELYKKTVDFIDS